MEQASEAIIIHDLKGKIIDANRQACKTLGYTNEELLSLNAVDLDSDATEDKGGLLWAKALAGRTVTFESTHRRKDKTILPVEVSLSSIGIGNETYIMALVRDITEKREIQEKLQNYFEDLSSEVENRTQELKVTQQQLLKSERLAAIGELAGMVGHDLRNPLTGIKNAVYILKKKGGECPEAQAKEMFEIIERSIDRSNKIINDLLDDYSRELYLERSKGSLHSLITSALQMVQIPHNVTVANHASGGPLVSIDESKMERVFINLLKNAIDSMPNGGTVEIESNQKGNEMEISFADTGVGIPERNFAKNLFAPCYN